jgi:hypothetical protein
MPRFRVATADGAALIRPTLLHYLMNKSSLVLSFKKEHLFFMLDLP